MQWILTHSIVVVRMVLKRFRYLLKQDVYDLQRMFGCQSQVTMPNIRLVTFVLVAFC
jgi:hypothetical protein